MYGKAMLWQCCQQLCDDGWLAPARSQHDYHTDPRLKERRAGAGQILIEQYDSQGVGIVIERTKTRG